ncbi:hypothetical protein A4X06_0g9432 [Tilletia controversa]|uniref:Uncharacterized protein n=1 Tax=Tilletia controversa TaxID=13291 RepID=A0A8X7MIM2_9BASI|nr:hypothetical protein A4X06_0g9432 [Tilletia controversa]
MPTSTYTITLQSHPNSPYSFGDKTFSFASGEYRIIKLGGNDSGLRPTSSGNGCFPAPLSDILSELTFYKSEFWFRDISPKSDRFGSLLNRYPVRQVRQADSQFVLASGDRLEFGYFGKPVGSRSDLDFLCEVICIVHIDETAVISTVIPNLHPDHSSSLASSDAIELDPKDAMFSKPSHSTSVYAPLPTISHASIPSSSSTVSPTSASDSTATSPRATRASAPKGTRWSGVCHSADDVRTQTSAVALTQPGGQLQRNARGATNTAGDGNRALTPISTTLLPSEPLPTFSYSQFVTSFRRQHPGSVEAARASGTIISPSQSSASTAQVADKHGLATADLALQRVASAWTDARRWVDSVARERSLEHALRRIYDAWQEARRSSGPPSPSTLVPSSSATSTMKHPCPDPDPLQDSRTPTSSSGFSSVDLNLTSATSVGKHLQTSDAVVPALLETPCFYSPSSPLYGSSLYQLDGDRSGRIHVTGSLDLHQIVVTAVIFIFVVLGSLIILQHLTLHAFARCQT